MFLQETVAKRQLMNCLPGCRTSCSCQDRLKQYHVQMLVLIVQRLFPVFRPNERKRLDAKVDGDRGAGIMLKRGTEVRQ
jgi:hypothetical protein